MTVIEVRAYVSRFTYMDALKAEAARRQAEAEERAAWLARHR